jgi:hypothetical protein
MPNPQTPRTDKRGETPSAKPDHRQTSTADTDLPEHRPRPPQSIPDDPTVDAPTR